MKEALVAWVDAAWPDISAAVTTAIKEKKGDELSAMIGSASAPAEPIKHVTLRWEEVPTTGYSNVAPEGEQPTTSHRLTAEPGRVFERRHTFKLPATQQTPFSTDALGDVTKWAAGVRASEKRWILERLAQGATAGSVTGVFGPPAVARTKGAGHRVAVDADVTGGPAAVAGACKKAGIEAYGGATLPSGIAVITFDAKYLANRMEDFTLGWERVSCSMITLVLTARYQFDGIEDQNPDVLTYSSVDLPDPETSSS